MDVTKISVETLLPYGKSFLYIDRIVSFDPEGELVCRKNLTYTDTYWTEGHFNDKPIFPGVLMIEAMCQSTALFEKLLVHGDSQRQNKRGLLCKVDVKFRHTAVPGDVVTTKTKKIGEAGTLVRYEVEASVDEQVCAKGFITGSVAPDL